MRSFDGAWNRLHSDLFRVPRARGSHGVGMVEAAAAVFSVVVGVAVAVADAPAGPAG